MTLIAAAIILLAVVWFSIDWRPYLNAMREQHQGVAANLERIECIERLNHQNALDRIRAHADAQATLIKAARDAGKEPWQE